MDVTPTGPDSSGYNMSLPEMSKNYKAQFKIDIPHWRKEWSKIHLYLTSDVEVQQATDAFIKNIWQPMSHVLQDAVKKQKERDQKEREDRSS